MLSFDKISMKRDLPMDVVVGVRKLENPLFIRKRSVKRFNPSFKRSEAAWNPADFFLR